MDRPRLDLRVLRPRLIHQDITLEGASGIYDVRLARPVGVDKCVFLEVALALAQGEYRAARQLGYDRWSTVIASLHTLELSATASLGIGIQVADGPAERRTGTTVAVYLPVNSREQTFASVVGTYGDFYNHCRALAGQVGLSLQLAHVRSPLHTLTWQVEAGSGIFVSPDGTEPGAVMFHFGMGLEGRLSRAALRLEYLDVFDLGGGYEHLRERFTHLLAAGIRLDAATVRPAVFVQMPIDPQFEEVLSSVVGFEVELLPARPAP